MKSPILAAALGLSLLSSSAPISAAAAQDAVFAAPAGGVASPIDRQFAVRAAAFDTFEVLSSRIALRRSGDPAVRDLARWMVESHAAAGRRLVAAAGTVDPAGGAEPVETPTTAAVLSDLAALDGAAFDRAYVAAQVDAHALAIRHLQDYAIQGSYAPLLRYDATALPEVNDHLVHFRFLQAHMPPPAGRS